MKHDPYSLTELIRNDDFVAWVRKPDERNEMRWRQFLQNNPRKKQTVESARRYIIFMGEDTGKSQPTSEQSDKMWKAVERHLRGEEEVKDDEIVEEETEPEPREILSGWRWARIAASTVLFAGMASFSYWYYINHSGQANRSGLTVNERSWENRVEKNNATAKPMMVLLPDGSSVVLEPGGILSYAHHGNAKTREVRLKGKAFFEIVKDANKPFLVYTFGLATKVLGTSFLIDAPKEGKEINVEVTTGKVSVFALDGNDNAHDQINSKGLKGFILNSSERIAFSPESGTFKKSLEKAMVTESERDISKQAFVFDETPVSKVFETLEKAYGVKIMYDRDRLGDFPLNATLTGQPFKGKLEVICSALDAAFEISGNRVTIVLMPDQQQKK